MQPMRLHVKARVEPALAPDTAAERDRGQTAVEPVAPLMVDADVIGGVAGKLAPHQRAAMCATVDKGFDRAALIPIEDDRRLADITRSEVARVRDFRRKAEKTPDRPAKDPLLLARIELGVMVESVGHSAVVERRPD